MLSTNFKTMGGMTLAELVVASAVSAVVLNVAIVTIQGILRSESTIRTGIESSANELPPSLASRQLVRDLEQADRVRIVNSATIQIRKPFMTSAPCSGVVPPASCFDNAANYRWVQYRFVDTGGPLGLDALKFYDDISAGCNSTQIIARQLGGNMYFSYADASTIAPPGGEPFAGGVDNNIVDFRFRWMGAVSSPVLNSAYRQFGGRVALRAAPYSDVNANAALGDSGSGLAPVGVSDPPAACP